MKRLRRGFTIIEVSLFLAITALVFAGIAVGTQNSIFQQRYNDAVQSFAEFLRTIYSQVTNVQSESTGTSDKAIYGKLVIFGEKSGKNEINTYNVIGDIKKFSIEEQSTNPGSLGDLIGLKASIKNEGNYVGFVENYLPRWGSQIQTTTSWEDGDNKYSIFKGALLVIRDPEYGTVKTFVSVGKDMGGIVKNNGEIKNGVFGSGQVDFCVNPNGASKSNLRRDVRIIGNARNASGIEIISEDSGDNICKK